MMFRDLARLTEAELADALQELEDAEEAISDDQGLDWCSGGSEDDERSPPHALPMRANEVTYYFH